MLLQESVFPKVIDNTYKLKKLIGSGGMGSVYLADDLRLDREVALKVLKASDNKDIDENEHIIRFQNEAKAVAKLNHPNIVSIYDIGRINHSDYMVMEYVEGQNLHDLLKKSKLSAKNILKISKQLCEVVTFIHSKNILHRDIKTANVLITSDFNIKLTDFGIAKNESNDNHANLTQAGSILGSILYSPPEQFINVRDLDNRSDIYSVGVCIYEMLTGNPPFADKENVREIIFSIIGKEIDPPSALSETIPNYFDELVLKALNKEPSKRYQSMKELLTEFELLEKTLILEETQSNMTLEELTRSTLVNTLNRFNKSSINIRDTRITTTLDLTNTTLNLQEFLSDFYADFSWVKEVTSKFNYQKQEITFSEILSKIREKDINGKRFSGIIANERYYLFVTQGVVFGAFDILNKECGDNVLESVNNNIVFQEIINTQQDENIPMLIYSALTMDFDCLHSNLNSSTVNLFEILDSLKNNEKKFNGYVICKRVGIQNIKEKYIFAYNNGEKILTLKIFNQLVTFDNEIEIENLVNTGNSVISIFTPKFSIPKVELNNLMVRSELFLKYQDPIDGTLNEIVSLGKEEVSHCLGEAVKNNIYFDVALKLGVKNLKIFDEVLDIRDLVKDDKHYSACLWIVTEFLFMLNISNNISYFRDLYKSSAEIVKFCILDELKGFHGCDNSYSIVAKNADDKIIFLARFGDGSKEDVEIFLEETTLVKKNLQKNKGKELYSAFYISENKIDNNAINYYYKNVKQEAGIFRKAKAYVKVSMTDGFNVLLLQKTDNDFSLIAPNLYQ